MKAALLINLTRMSEIYSRLALGKKIKVYQVFGDRGDLEKIGKWMMTDDVKNMEKAFKHGLIKRHRGQSISENTQILCLYLPPFYAFINLNKT